MLENILDRVRQEKPLIHNITNYVTIHDCANILLACGASPIMADDLGEVEEITSRCNGLTLNMGTLKRDRIPSMLAAGKAANQNKIPVVLDPVGAGSSTLRTETAFQLLHEISFTAIRGNFSELKALAAGCSTKGVDAQEGITPQNLESARKVAAGLAQKTGAVIAMTGAIDLVTDGKKTCCIYNGHPMMGRVTGTGCQLSAMTAAYVAANPDKPFEAVAGAVCAMGLCGEIAFGRMEKQDGNASYGTYIIDAVYRLTQKELEEGARYEIR